jgi:hypothetical protein
MTGLLTAVRRSLDFEAGTVSPGTVSVAGAFAAFRAAAFALLSVTVVVLVGWATAADTGASASQAVRACFHTWLLAHHTELVTTHGSFALVPLGLTLMSGWLLFTGGSRAARSCSIRGNRGVAALTCALAATYAVLAAVIAVVAETDGVRPLPVTAFLGAGAVSALAGGAGAVRGAGTGAALWRRVPPNVAVAAQAAAGATGVLLSGGALVMAVALISKFSRLRDLAHSLDAGALGVLLLGLLSVAYVPTAVLWSTSFVLGPGFAVGAGTTVSPFGTTLGATPAFPPLAALPAGGGRSAAAMSLLLVPVIAGVVAGLLVDRADGRRRTPLLTTWRSVLLLASTSGAWTGTAILLGALLSDGPGGPGRLVHVGMSWWQAGLASAGWVTVFATITLFARRPALLPGVLSLNLRLPRRSVSEGLPRRLTGTRLWLTR